MPTTFQPVLHDVQLPDGRILNVAEYGDSLGEPMLFLHGTPGSHLLASLIATEARAHGFRVLAPDRPGIGFSSPHPTRTYSSFAEDIRHVLAHFDLKRVHLVGISGGSPYALAIAARMPEALRQFVLLSPWWYPHGATDAREGLNPLFSCRARKRWEDSRRVRGAHQSPRPWRACGECLLHCASGGAWHGGWARAWRACNCHRTGCGLSRHAV